MKLYIGGVCQGQKELAEAENKGAEFVYDFQELLRDVDDARKFAMEFCCAHPNCVVIADEVGCGVVPIGREERLWREKAGRALCVIAQHSESVTRVICGIGMRLK